MAFQRVCVFPFHYKHIALEEKSTEVLSSDCVFLTMLTGIHFILSRAIHDVKATDLGMSKVRFKAEVDFDGRVVTRSYLEKQDIDQLLNVSCFLLVISSCDL